MADISTTKTGNKRGRRSVWQVLRPISTGLYVMMAVASFLLVLIAWSLLSYGGFVEQIFLPTPLEVAKQFFNNITSPEYWEHIGISVFRVFGGFMLACLIGIPLGILAGTFKIGEALVEPQMEFIRYMPAVAFIPLVMVWAGIGEWAKILIIFIGCFFQLVLMVAVDTRRVSHDLIQAAMTLGATRWQLIESVIFQALRPHLMNTLRLILGWAWTYLVVAELVAVNSGLGYQIMKAQRFLNTSEIFVGILVIGLLGLICDRFFAYLNKRFFPWAS
jgi:NitT/TauT family transport system permease protein